MKAKKTKRDSAKTVKKTTRVTVDFPVAQHRKIKALAALEGVSLQEYIRHKVLLEDIVDHVADDELKPIVDEIIDRHADVLERLSKYDKIFDVRSSH